MSWSPRPVICWTAETRPAANSPWPATIARGCTRSTRGVRSLLIVFCKISQHVSGLAHLAHQPLVESLGGIDSAVLQQMVEGDDFGDDCDVLPRIERDANLWQLDVEDRRRFRVEARSVDGRVLIPLLELNDDLNALLLPHSADAENRRNVHEPNAANFHMMSLELMSAPDQDVRAAAARHDEIVGHEAVATLDEVEHTLRFSNAALPDHEESYAEHVSERAMQVRRRREFFLEPRLDARVELVRLELRANKRNAGSRRELDEIGGRDLPL